MAVTGTTAHDIAASGIFFGRSQPLHPIISSLQPHEGALWVVSPFIYTPIIGQDPNGNPIFTQHPPWDINDLITAGPLGQTTPWLPGQSITLGNGQQAHWDGTQWKPGPVPLPLSRFVNAGSPGTYDANHRAAADLAELQTMTPVPGTRWNVGTWVETTNNIEYYWDGANWQSGRTPMLLATTVTSGKPGTFGPAGRRPPATLAELNTINGGTSWVVTTDQGAYVTVGATDYYWDGAQWIAGRAPMAASSFATAGKPGWFDARVPADLAEMRRESIIAIPATKWDPGNWVVTANQVEYYWDGTDWQSGRSPAGPALATGVAEGKPGTWTPANSLAPTTKLQLDSINGGTAAWATPGSWVSIGPLATDEYYWDGAQWVQGRVPGGVATGDRQIMATSLTGPVGIPPQSPDNLPQILQVGVYAGPSLSMRWSQVTSSSTVTAIVIRIASPTGQERWRTSTAFRNDITLGLQQSQLPVTGDFIFLEYHYANGNVSTFRAEMY